MNLLIKRKKIKFIISDEPIETNDYYIFFTSDLRIISERFLLAKRGRKAYRIKLVWIHRSVDSKEIIPIYFNGDGFNEEDALLMRNKLLDKQNLFNAQNI